MKYIDKYKSMGILSENAAFSYERGNDETCTDKYI